MAVPPPPSNDSWIDQQATTFELSTIEDCSIAVDAKYFLDKLLNSSPSSEPLVSALGGLTGMHVHIDSELAKWEAHRVTPFFVFDGQPIRGEDDGTIADGLEHIRKANAAWTLYFGGNATQAVSSFGSSQAFRPDYLYPLLQRILRKRKLHYIVAPFKASAQIAYFDMIDSDQCAGIMGSKELMFFPINDAVIRSIDWDNGTVKAISKKNLIKNLNVTDSMFIDALLMMGADFLPIFPPLLDTSINPRPPSIADAINMLRTSEKNMAKVCNTFSDILKAKDPEWLDKFQKARMFVNHFIYISESGKVCVHDEETLTGDNHEYLGFQLSEELYHYLDKGLIGPRVLSWFTHSRVTILPTLDGFVSDEYRSLVTKQLVPYYETALRLLGGRLNRAFVHSGPIFLRVWYDSAFSLKLNIGPDGKSPAAQSDKWNLSPELLAKYFPPAAATEEDAPRAAGSISFEVKTLADKGFADAVLQAPKTKNLESADAIVSLTLWKLLTLRGYVAEETLALTPWGVALAKTLTALEPVARAHPAFASALGPAALLGWELIRLDLLNSRGQYQELHGLPINGTAEDKDSGVLISRVASLLQMRQDTTGYTGPLNKNLLAYRSLVVTVAETNRSLIDSVLAYTFVTGQAQRERDDLWEIGHRLPFLEYPDAALSIAVKTFLDESHADKTPEEKEARKKSFPTTFVPYALDLFEDFAVAFGLFEALYAGVTSLGSSEMNDESKALWERAHLYLERKK